MATSTRYKVLRISISSAGQKNWAKRYSEFKGINNYSPPQSSNGFRSSDLWACVGQVAMNHLQLSAQFSPQQSISDGASVAIDYFLSGWWANDKRWGPQIDKSLRPRRLTWFGSFRFAFLLVLLSQNWNDVDRLCSWVDADLKPEALSEDFDDHLAIIYKSLAAGLRSTPMKGLKTQEKKMLNCQTPGVKLLFQAWKAAQNGKQEEFGSAFLAAVQNFKKTSGRGPTPIDWIAIDHSIVAMAAIRHGMQLPSMNPAESAVIVLPETLGLKARRK